LVICTKKNLASLEPFSFELQTVYIHRMQVI
jgi:hypothetical protein